MIGTKALYRFRDCIPYETITLQSGRNHERVMLYNCETSIEHIKFWRVAVSMPKFFQVAVLIFR